MSGDFRPEQNTAIEATDDEALARQHGLTYFDRDRGQWVARDATAEGDNEDPARLDAEVVPSSESGDTGFAERETERREGDEAEQREVRDETAEEHEANAEGTATPQTPKTRRR